MINIVNLYYSNKIFLLLTLWILTIYIYSYFSLNNFHYFNNYILTISSLVYLFIFMKQQNTINYTQVITLYVILKLSILIMCLFNETLFNSYMVESDATLYHIPKILSLNYDNFIQYISDYRDYGNTGKLTHLFYAIIFNIFQPIVNILDVSINKFLIILVYIIDTFIILLTVNYLSNILSKEEIENEFIIYSTSLILFSPFILYHSSFVLKETLYFSLIILSVIAIIRSNYLLLILICSFFIVDRFYMIYFFGILFLLSNKFSYKHLIYILSLGIILILTFESLLNVIVSYLQTYFVLLNKTELSTQNVSLLSINGYLGNVLRGLFNPFFLSAFKDYFIEQNILFKEFFLIHILYLYFIVKIFLVKSNKFSILIIFIFLINIVMFPYSMRQKLTILIPLIAIIYPLYLHCRKNNIELRTLWRI